METPLGFGTELESLRTEIELLKRDLLHEIAMREAVERYSREALELARTSIEAKTAEHNNLIRLMERKEAHYVTHDNIDKRDEANKTRIRSFAAVVLLAATVASFVLNYLTLK